MVTFDSLGLMRSMSSSIFPGFQHTMAFSHDLDRIRSPSQRTQST
uniref:Uncharacterized protein n=1 Tax=Anguilla anguilla TaxID=7936 RepID=A0A0E9XD41_ANGAN